MISKVSSNQIDSVVLWFSLWRYLLPQQSKPLEQNPGGFRPQYMPIILSASVYMFTFLLLALLDSAAPFHRGLMYTEEQARKKILPKPPAAQKYQATPTDVFPHPPHQWGGSVAERGALPISKPQHTGVRQTKFLTPWKIGERSHPCTAGAPAQAPPKRSLQSELRREAVPCHSRSQARQNWWVKFYRQANCRLVQATTEKRGASLHEELPKARAPASCSATCCWTSTAFPKSWFLANLGSKCNRCKKWLQDSNWSEAGLLLPSSEELAYGQVILKIRHDPPSGNYQQIKCPVYSLDQEI